MGKKVKKPANSAPQLPLPDALSALRAIVANDSEAFIALESLLDGRESWGYLENKPIPLETKLRGYVYTSNAAVAKALVDHKKLLTITSLPNLSGETPVYKLRLQDEVAKQLPNHVDEITHVRGFTGKSFLNFSLTPKTIRVYAAPLSNPERMLLVLHNPQGKLDDLIASLEDNGLTRSTLASVDYGLGKLNDGTSYVSIEVSSSLYQMLNRSAYNTILDLREKMPNAVNARYARQPFKSAESWTTHLNAALAIKKTAPAKMQAAEETAHRDSTPPSKVTNPPLTPARTLSDDGPLLSKALIFTRKRLADGNISPFITIDRQALPTGIKASDIRERLKGNGYYQQIFPSIRILDQGLLIAPEDLSTLQTLIRNHHDSTPLRHDETVQPFKIHDKVIERQQNIRKAIRLLAGSASDKGQTAHYLYFTYQPGKPALRPLGDEVLPERITQPNETPIVERLLVPDALWGDVRSQLSIEGDKLINGGLPSIRRQVLDDAARQNFGVREVSPDAVAQAYKGHRKKNEKKDPQAEKALAKIEEAIDRGFDLEALEKEMTGLVASSPDDKTNLLLIGSPISLRDPEDKKRLNESLSGKTREEKILIQKSFTQTFLKHPVIAVRAPEETLERLQKSLQALGLLHSVQKDAAKGQDARVFVLKSGESAEAFFAKLAKSSEHIQRFSANANDALLNKAKHRFADLDEALIKEHHDPVAALVTHMAGREVTRVWVEQIKPEEFAGLHAVGRLQSYVAGAGLRDVSKHMDNINAILKTLSHNETRGIPALPDHLLTLTQNVRSLETASRTLAELIDTIDSGVTTEAEWVAKCFQDHPAVSQWFIANPTPFTHEALSDPAVRAMMMRAPVLYPGVGPNGNPLLCLYPNSEMEALLMRQRPNTPLLNESTLSFKDVPDILRERYRPIEEDASKARSNELPLEQRLRSKLIKFNAMNTLFGYEKPNDPPPFSDEAKEKLAEREKLTKRVVRDGAEKDDELVFRDVAAEDRIGTPSVLLIKISNKNSFAKVQGILEALPDGFTGPRVFTNELISKKTILTEEQQACRDILIRRNELKEAITQYREIITRLKDFDIYADNRESNYRRVMEAINKHPEFLTEFPSLSIQEEWPDAREEIRRKIDILIAEQDENREKILELAGDAAAFKAAEESIKTPDELYRQVEQKPTGIYTVDGHKLDSYNASMGEMIVKIYPSAELGELLASALQQNNRDFSRESRFLPLNQKAPRIGTADELAAHYSEQLRNPRGR
ncbi:MAG: hypothetical protein K2Q12_08425 [Rickettsiales bacterium]|nr:hypothetical protein [Rickettsiales bacterium]